ncbi:MAG TPA: EAL domain-containing protein, partial [Candidatus Eisenbacteria bacterium]|nr:EAL domain-containing protein [Candidatus Eisenbacteria bacterium]
GLVAAAALHPSMRWAARAGRARSVTIGTGHVGLLIVAILFGPAIVIWRFSDRGSWVVLAAAGPATVSLLVVAHLSRMISERQRLEFASNHDALTGLVNRSCFQDRVGAALQDASLRGESLAVMFLDLDRFKTVNDSLGHDAGDEMLKQVAVRLTDCARDSDTVARISVDEFAVLLPAVTTAEQAAEIATRMLEHFAGLFDVAGHDLVMSPSIGVAMAPAHGDDVETLLRHADAAMYQAKAAGRNTMRMYDGSMGAAAQRQLSLESRIRDAIERAELVLHYQPKLDARTGSVVGVEALVRWAHPDMGLSPPAAFMRVVEDSGLIAPLGEWVLRNACAQAARWRAEGHCDLPVSVNVSARQFQLQDVPTVVRDALVAASLPADSLELELTESVGLDPSGTALRALQEVQRLGVRCSIDDFGTGYSSIGYLKDYPINAIKLDRSFVEDVRAGEDAPIVRAVIAMAHHLGLRVVAEGVETTAQRDFLRRNGCDELQGFLFSRPLPEDELMAYLADRPETLGAPALRVVPDSQEPCAAWDEERLGRVVWEQSRARGLVRDAAGLLGAEEAGHDNLRRTLVITTASAAVALPLFLGLGAGGGLPPDLQSQVDGAVQALG